jgi:hypothetical protein
MFKSKLLSQDRFNAGEVSGTLPVPVKCTIFVVLTDKLGLVPKRAFEDFLANWGRELNLCVPMVEGIGPSGIGVVVLSVELYFIARRFERSGKRNLPQLISEAAAKFDNDHRTYILWEDLRL